MKDELKIIGLTDSQIQAAALTAAKKVKRCGWPEHIIHDKFMYSLGVEISRLAIHSDAMDRLVYDNSEHTDTSR